MFSTFLAALLAVSATYAGPLAYSATREDRRSIFERDGTNVTVFEHAASGAVMEFVTNSGVCETTPGVNQYSGYLSIGSNQNMWFWFFEARNSPATAPLATWFNGGPGCSSMIGLFQENGPCHFVNGASTPTLNPNSFNNYANMLYIDQPIGVGFSYGTDDVSSTIEAAPEVWKLLQAFFSQFPQYENRDFGIFTESYGGHYGPEFAQYFQSQNAAIAAGSVTGEQLNLVALGINNGWYDPEIQYKAYVDYSYNNTYQSLISEPEYQQYLDTYSSDCQPAIQQCASSGLNADCANAQTTCYNEIEGPLSQSADFDVYDIREPSNDPFPPKTYATYLQTAPIQQKIGAKVKYQECPEAPYDKFSTTGDDSRSTLPQLSNVVSSGSVQTLIWAGDADWICNWFGGFDVANVIEYPGQSAFAAAAVQPYSVGGTEMGTYKAQGKLSWLRVYGAGHEVPYYQPTVALQVFEQTMKGQGIFST